ncbi:MAG: LysR substrate-binding domain-containing protein [Pseudomonadota bacterium]
MSLDLRSLELFVRVATLGAIGKAGAELGLSRTTATQRIQDLETTVGAQLLHRTTRSVSLSVDGEAFLEHAKRILGDVDEAISDLQSDPTAVGGELRVASSASFGRKFLAPLVAEFLDRYPKLSVQLHLSDTTFDIVENGFDLAVRLGTLAPSTLKVRRIAESPRIVVAAPSYLTRFGEPQRPSELSEHNCVTRSDVRIWSKRWPDGSVHDCRVSGNFSTNLAEAVTEAALSGVGIARKCAWEVSEHLETGDLVEILQDYTVLPEWSIYAVRSPSRILSVRVRAFTEFLTQKFKDIPSLAGTGQ